jgi:hypothetical protein
MAWSFGDSFDLYSDVADMVNGYWDSSSGNLALATPGRFPGTGALNPSLNSALVKASNVNDAVHHIVCAFQQASTITGPTPGLYFELFDGATAQCSIVFRTDGAIFLTSGGPAGTVLATYTGAVTVINTWYAFEFEVVIHPTAGSFIVRKNGNNVADFTATALNTRVSANSYANKLQTGGASGGTGSHYCDDLFWRSGSSVAWLGDIRCYARMPLTDVQAQFSRSPTSVTQTPVTSAGTLAIAAGTARYGPFTASYDGTISAVTVSLTAGYTGNMKCSIFASSGTLPTTVLGSATPIVNPATGTNTFTFSAPPAVAKGAQYWIGFDSDASSGTWTAGSGIAGITSATSYASFPVASPSPSLSQSPAFYSLTLTTGSNAGVVSEPQQNALTSYVYDSNPGDADFYSIGSIVGTPAVVIATVTRAFAEKSDAGTRTLTVQMKSGATTVASPIIVLTTSGWTWAWRMDLTDPNTGAAWTAAAVNNIQIGPKVIA